MEVRNKKTRIRNKIKFIKMVWVIIVLLAIVIISSIIDFSCNAWTVTSQFFTDSWAGIAAAILGIASLLMFYGSGKSYKELKINETFLPNPKRNKQKEKEYSMSEDLKAREFDLSKMTMETLVQKMAYEMTKPGPVFFKGWGNRRLELDVERVRILGFYVEEIRNTGSQLMELQADAALSFEKIECLTKIKRNELAEKLRRSELLLDFIEEEHKHTVRKMALENAEKEAQVRLINAQAEEIETKNLIRKLLAQGRYKFMIATSRKERKIATILSKGAESYADLPPVLKSYVLTQLGNENSVTPGTDMDLHEQLKEFIVRKHKAETQKIEYDADEHKEQSETQKAKLRREREKYKKNGE